MTDSTHTVRFVGPEGQVSDDVAAALVDGDTPGDPRLEPGREYALPADLAVRLARSSQMWEPVDFELVDETAPEGMTVKQLDDAFGQLEGWPKSGKHAEKVGFAQRAIAAATEGS